MKCPVLHPDGEYDAAAILAIPQDCLQAECAWWHIGGAACAVLSIAKNLTYIEEHTARVVSRD